MASRGSKSSHKSVPIELALEAAFTAAKEHRNAKYAELLSSPKSAEAEKNLSKADKEYHAAKKALKSQLQKSEPGCDIQRITLSL